jgi:hypothetical protein
MVRNSMARKPLVSGGKDVPDEPRRAPVFERARQLGQLTGDDRHHVALEVTALVEQGADRLASAMAPPRETAFSLPCRWRTEFLRGPHAGIAIERQSVCWRGG